MSVIDTFLFNGERDILRIHLSVLNDYVDKFIIVEANKTFQGATKPLYFFRDQRYFKPWWAKIEYYVINNWDDVELWEKAIDAPIHRDKKREFYIRESTHKAFKEKHVQDDDMVFIGDVGNIIDPNANYASTSPFKARQIEYAHYLNTPTGNAVYGTLVANYGQIKHQCLTNLRSAPNINSKGENLGWHFRRNTAPTTVSIDETAWPLYLKKNKKEYKHLCLSV